MLRRPVEQKLRMYILCSTINVTVSVPPERHGLALAPKPSSARFPHLSSEKRINPSNAELNPICSYWHY